MPRQARIDAPGALHHIICRGIERGTIYLNDVDRDDFVDRLSSIATESQTPCYAWTLIPNHFHLLLRTGNVPIVTVMRRLLTGYAVSFNHRHRRRGCLFQNRYKSILCQEDPYFMELVRYIHLNPLRAGVVADVDALDSYAYSGHSRLTGHISDNWQAVSDSEFVMQAIESAQEQMEERYRQAASGYTFERVIEQVSEPFGISVECILSPSKQPDRVKARSVAAYLAVRRLGLDGTTVGKRMGLGQSAISRAVARGELLSAELDISFRT